MPPRLTAIGDHERPDHYHLPATAVCYFWGEYTPYEHTDGMKWNFSSTNQLISNFKKKMDRAGCADWRYKEEAIQRVANVFAKFWKWGQLQEMQVALIPIPPSKPRTHAMYDARMMQALSAIPGIVGLPLDIRDCLSFSGKYAASHESADRPTPDDLYRELAFDPVQGRPANKPGVIFLFDDMLTSGAHYLAVSRLLAEVYPGVPIVGNFIARRIVPNPFDDFDDLDSV